jgi:CRP-like cAMP-binding protein
MVDLAAGDILFRAGDAAPDAFILNSGELAVQVHASGKPKTVAHIRPGEVVGEMGRCHINGFGIGWC